LNVSLMKTCIFRARLAVLPLALAAAFPVVAQAQTAPLLAETVVTASRVATPVTDVIADVSILDRATLDQSGQSSLRDILAQLPGVQWVSNGSYRSGTNIFLRGATNSQSIVLIDGVRVGSATSGGAALENMPLDRIERVEVLRGAASALYGPDAVGGVIQIFTREPTEALQLSANVGAGSDGQRQAGASIRGSAGVIGYSLGVSEEKASGISVSNAPTASGYNPDADSFDSNSLDARLTAKLSKAHALTLSVLHSQSEYQTDTFQTKPNPLKLSKYTTDTWSKPVLNNLNLKWDAQWTPIWKSTVLLGRSDEESVIDYRRMSDGALNSSSKFNTQRTQATWQNDVTLGKDVLSFMLENRSEAVDSSTVYKVTERTIESALASYAFNRDSWNALAVLRNDHNSQFGSFNTWALSGGYRLTPSLRAVASMGTSFQAPTLNQLYYPLTDGFKGDPTLTPQTNRASEFGLKHQQGPLMMGAVVYYNEIQGFISPSTNAQSSMAVLRGVTLSADLQSGETRYSVSYDYADPRSYSSKPALDDLRLPRVAQNMFNARVTQRLGDVNLFGELKLSSDREDGKVVLHGYGLMNLGATWKLRKDLTLLGRINNLTDTQYMLANGYAMPGRNVFASLTWSL
jgi:vitamin B12 transporter